MKKTKTSSICYLHLLPICGMSFGATTIATIWKSHILDRKVASNYTPDPPQGVAGALDIVGFLRRWWFSIFHERCWFPGSKFDLRKPGNFFFDLSEILRHVLRDGHFLGMGIGIGHVLKNASTISVEPCRNPTNPGFGQRYEVRLH